MCASCSKTTSNQNNVIQREAEVEAPSASLLVRLWGATRTTFHSLTYRSFRYLWIGGWFSNVGTWLQNIALGWLVYKLTESSATLGIVHFASSIPVFFLSFYAGALTDRLNRRSMLVWSNGIAMVLAFILGLLVGLKLVTVASIVAISFLSGVAFAFAFPSWQSMISELVPRKDLMNAIALNASQFHAARLIGPAIAGIIIARLGIDWAFYLNAFSFLAVILALYLIDYTPAPRGDGAAHRGRGTSLASIREGFAYAWKRRQVMNYLLAVGIVSVFGLSFFSTLMPIFADRILRSDIGGYSGLMSINGMGALASSLVMAWLSGRARPVSILRISIVGLGVSLVVFALSHIFWLSAVCMFLTGFFFLLTNSTLNTAIQVSVENEYRGRIMSIFVWMFMGLSPFGSLAAGFLGKAIGVQGTTALAAGVILALGIVINARLALAPATQNA
jgi:MFS family permease